MFATLGCLIAASCGNTSPEEKVKNYGKYFVEKVSAGQLDSLKSSYPDILLADSITQISSDTVTVTETAPGKFDVALAGGVILKVDHNDDGNITVKESHGLFRFPEQKVDIAKKTGMWVDSLSDVQLLQRIKDDAFFAWLKKQNKNKTKNILTVVNSGNGFYEQSYEHIVNHTSVPIKGSEYRMIRTGYRYDSSGNDVYGSFTTPGRDIPANGKIKVISNMAPDGFGDGVVTGIKWNLSQDQLQLKFAPYTGKEYEQYLKTSSSKKK